MKHFALIQPDGRLNLPHVTDVFEGKRPSLVPELMEGLREVEPEVRVGFLQLPDGRLVAPPGPELRFPVWTEENGWQNDPEPIDQEREETANRIVNHAYNRALTRVLGDLEARLRAAGQPSKIPEIAAVPDADLANYRFVLKQMVKGEL